MKKYFEIGNKTSGCSLGVYYAESKLSAYRAMLDNAYDSTFPRDIIPDDIEIRDAFQSAFHDIVRMIAEMVSGTSNGYVNLIFSPEKGFDVLWECSQNTSYQSFHIIKQFDCPAWRADQEDDEDIFCDITEYLNSEMLLEDAWENFLKDKEVMA